MNLCRVVGYNVRGYRKAAHMSQIALGDAAGVDRTYVGQVERAEKSIGIENLGKLATGLGVSPAELVTDGLMVRGGREEQARQTARRQAGAETRRADSSQLTANSRARTDRTPTGTGAGAGA